MKPKIESELELEPLIFTRNRIWNHVAGSESESDPNTDPGIGIGFGSGSRDYMVAFRTCLFYIPEIVRIEGWYQSAVIFTLFFLELF